VLTSLALTGTSTLASSSDASIEAAAAWIRWLPAGLPAAGYVRLINTGDKAMYLISAASPDFEEVSLHRTVEHGGTVSMVTVGKLLIGPHSTIELGANSYHFMLMRPRNPLQPGGHVPVTLSFLGSESLTVQFEVRK
jgi:copper(I)-binding protein